MTESLRHSKTLPSPAFVGVVRRSRLVTRPKLDSEDVDLPEYEELKELKMILKLNVKERSAEMLKKLYDYTLNLKFFKKVLEEYSEEVCLSCCKYIQYEYHHPQSFVCRQGEKGTKFYIILNGTARVLVENPDLPYKQQVGELSTGDTFGERAIMLSIPRAASIQCASACHLAVLNASDYRKILDNMFEEKFDSIVEVLKKLPILQGFSKNYVQRLGYYFKQKKYRKGQFVYKEKDKADCIFIIQDGEFRILKSIKVTIKSPKAFPEKSLLKTKNHAVVSQLASLFKGEMFGEEDILNESNGRSTACICHSEIGKVLMIAKEDFFKHIVVTEEAKDAMRRRNVCKQEFRGVIMDKSLKLKKMHIGILPLDIKTPRPKSMNSSPKPIKHQSTSSLRVIDAKTDKFKETISESDRKPPPILQKPISLERPKKKKKKSMKIEIRNIHT